MRPKQVFGKRGKGGQTHFPERPSLPDPLFLVPPRSRVVFPGVAHHVTQCGNDRQPVFHSADDRRLCWDLLSRYAARSRARASWATAG